MVRYDGYLFRSRLDALLWRDSYTRARGLTVAPFDGRFRCAPIREYGPRGRVEAL